MKFEIAYQKSLKLEFEIYFWYTFEFVCAVLYR